ncbi:MAG TPA: hypothetical protein VF071_02080 [Candidatus Limnocylindria bacterium]
MRRLTAVLMAIAILVMAATPALAGKASTRPLSDWLDAQQLVLDPMVPIELLVISWYEPDSGEQYLADMDGRVAMWVTANGGAAHMPSISGSVHERLLPDGRALVKINLRFNEAITYVWRDENNFEDFPEGPELFGYRASEIADGADPVLGDGWFSISFINPVPGGPLPELGQLAFEPDEGQEVIDVSFHAAARGPLREASGWTEGTYGQAATQQIGVFQGRTPDGYPVEWVTLHPVGG